MATNSQIAFTPLGDTVLIPADTSASLGLQVPVYSRFKAQDVGQYRIVNAGTSTVFLGFGVDALTAQADNSPPSDGNPTGSIALLPGAVEILRFPPDAFFSGVAVAASTVYMTPGQGL